MLMQTSLSFSVDFDNRILKILDKMTPSELADWWFQWIDNIFFDWIPPGKAFYKWGRFLYDGNDVISNDSVIDQLVTIFLWHLAPEQKEAISQRAEEKLRNVNIIMLHDNYHSLENLKWNDIIPVSIIGVENWDELIWRYMSALLRFTEKFQSSRKLQLSTSDRIGEIQNSK